MKAGASLWSSVRLALVWQGWRARPHCRSHCFSASVFQGGMCWIKLNVFYLEESLQDLAHKFGNISSNRKDISIFIQMLQELRFNLGSVVSLQTDSFLKLLFHSFAVWTLLHSPTHCDNARKKDQKIRQLVILAKRVKVVLDQSVAEIESLRTDAVGLASAQKFYF